ncbi:universal stress protein [Edaphobacter modestus]|uniref:Nucleotide-binding universal stress UspA family protein n=1 Tax=Edaphobacter modestus TaxID=388466 RepID=A0A4Q7Z296_9BACT|nr:universal stress protein [Edaphobacter modestus]RZU43649.1 nucleotide-binding universal stress UspA family protein [Edaphobacter modestus]
MYKNVLIAINDSPAAERALHRAIALAEIDNGDLFVVSIDEGLPVFESIVWAVSDNLAKILEEDRMNLYRHLLDDAQKQAQSHSIHLHSTLAEGKPADSILEAVQQVHADLLVLGISPHFGIGGLILGSTAMELARRARCDVLGVH